MKAVDFDQVNVKIAEHQEEYQTLPAHVDERGIVTACFELDEEEKIQVAEEGRIYLSLHTFGRPLQPIRSSVMNPFSDNQNQEEE